MGNRTASTSASRLLYGGKDLVAMRLQDETGSQDEKKNVRRNPQQQTDTLEYASVRTEKKQT